MSALAWTFFVSQHGRRGGTDDQIQLPCIEKVSRHVIFSSATSLKWFERFRVREKHHGCLNLCESRGNQRGSTNVPLKSTFPGWNYHVTIARAGRRLGRWKGERSKVEETLRGIWTLIMTAQYHLSAFPTNVRVIRSILESPCYLLGSTAPNVVSIVDTVWSA